MMHGVEVNWISSGQLGHCDGTGLHNYVRKAALRSQPQFSDKVKLIDNLEVALKADSLEVSPKLKLCITSAKKS